MKVQHKMSSFHERDNRIVFHEEPHIYVIDNDADVKYTSVTTVIHKFFSKFDADDAITKMKRSGNFEKKHKGKTAAEVKDLWKSAGQEACTLGTNLHACIEDTYNNVELKEDILQTVHKEYDLFRNFYRDTEHKYEPYRFEWRIFDEDIKVAGSIDAVFKKKDSGKYFIVDWKRVKEIKVDNQYQTALPPISHLKDCNFTQYALQLNLYKYILEAKYGIEIDELILVVM